MSQSTVVSAACDTPAAHAINKMILSPSLISGHYTAMPGRLLQHAIHMVPAGRWAVAVSGGADSTALLSLLLRRDDLHLHVVHLDHQTRGQASTGDACFVADLARRYNLPCTVARREELEPLIGASRNPSAHYRALRLELFRRVIAEHRLDGVLLAHHADDQAETVLQRLLRGSNYAGLAGMELDAQVGGVCLVRPLLAVRRPTLRRWLAWIGQDWREDDSNASDHYQRNRARKLLAERPALFDLLLRLGEDCRHLRNWVDSAAPIMAERFPVAELADLPPLLAERSARCWLIARGAATEELSDAVVARLVALAADAAGPPAMMFPPRLRVRRRSGIIFAG